MFAAFFATYAVLMGETTGGPSGKGLFNLDSVALETGLLLTSGFTCGMPSIGAQRQNGTWFHGAKAVTFLLGTGLIALELREFTGLVAQLFAKGYRPDILRRLLCFSLLWHALDIIWVAVFTVVYLMRAGQ